MRKVLYLVALLGLISTQTKAVYYPITQHPSGVQAVGGINVTVNPINPPMVSAQNFCGVGPYYPHANRGWNYAFSSPVTHVRLTFADLHSDDTIRLLVNSALHQIAAADLTAYAGSCSPQATYTLTPNGELTATNPTGVGAGVIVNVENTPNFINNITVMNVGPTAAGAGYLIEFQIDSCDQTFTVTHNDPCALRQLRLDATDFPGATFNWTGPLGYTANTNPAYRSPMLGTHTGWYAAFVQWGTCSFVDSVYVDVNLKPTPFPPVINSLNPPISSPITFDSLRVCRNMDVEVQQQSSGGTGVDYYWYGPWINPPQQSTDGILKLPLFQPNQVGRYYAYAVNPVSGCISDTTFIDIDTLADVVAAMPLLTPQYGCTEDTLTVIDNSTGKLKTWVFFNPVINGNAGTNIVDSTGNPVIYIYKPHVLRDTIPDTFDVKILVSNNVCVDSITQRVVFNHPLRADFTVSEDTICQGTEIKFTNTTSAAVGPTHIYFWDFKNGDTAQTFSVDYTYKYQGVYLATLTVTDYLGCVDSAQRYIFVDSTGAIWFNVSDSVVCAGDKIDFEGNFEHFGNVRLLWEFGDGNSVADTPFTQHGFDIPGTYPVKFTSFNRVCPDTFSVREMVVHPYPLVDVGPDTSICPNGEPVYIREAYNNGNPDARYSWNTPVGRDTASFLVVRHPGVYAATVEIDGCATTDSVAVLKNCYVTIPNAFTPNGDGHDEYFLPRQFLSMGVKNFTMTIFNRWGQKVFETTSIDGRGWDGMFNGEPQPMGVYIYQINATFKNNVTESYTGNVTLLR